MRNERALVVGATGMLGEPVARRLLADGWQVRCLVRDEARARAKLGDGFEYVRGDVTRPETLDAAFDGAAVVHLNLRGADTIESQFAQEVAGARHCAMAAARHGLRRISYLSGSGRTGAELMHHYPVAVKKAVEDALAACGVPWTAFRATHFMESLASFVRDGRATVPGRQPHRLHYLAVEDYAGMASRALDHEGCENRALHLWGPEAYTMREALERFVAAVHPGTKVGSMPLWVIRALGTVTGKAELKLVAALFAAFEEIGEAGDPSEANRLLGAPRTTLAQWLAARARA
jgi:uncharacterized protein YbjT (DUF2867 family)